MRLSRGFTLLEVLIATAMLAGAFVIVTMAWSGNTLRVRKASTLNNVATLLERKTAELEAKFKNKPLGEIIDEEGDFGSDFPGYKWKFKAKEFEMPDLTPILMGQKKDGQDQMFLDMIKQVTEFLGKAVKEGTVTVIAQSGKKELAFSITTYFVDYNTEFALPGVPGTSAPAAPAPPPPGGR